MDLTTKLRFEGCLNTSSLWKNKAVSKFKQIELPNDKNIFDNLPSFKNNRLGKLVEEFVFHKLKYQPEVTWIADNIQIQKAKQTIGEIDALYYDNNVPIHLEIVYKFYLYDTINSYDTSLAYWIGPNRKDSLLYKLEKLENKQFPLLSNSHTNTYLKKYDLNINSILQQLCFKGQLFLPYLDPPVDITPLNPLCISGFYISYKDIKMIKHLEFYIPEKLDWLITPHNNVNWLNFDSIIDIIQSYIYKELSPLVWLKYNNKIIKKCFITFW